MKQITGRKIVFAVAAGLFAVAGSVPAMAAEIKKVRIKLAAETFDEEGKPEVDFLTDSDEYEIVGFEEQPEHVYEVELAAEDGKSFGRMDQKDIRLTGIKASCSRAVRKSGKEVLELTIKAEGLDDVIGEIGRADFSNGSAVWDKADNACTYAVMLFRNSKRVGYTHKTQGTSYNFSPLMKEKGIYHYKVYPLSVNEKKGIPVESEWYSVNESEAEKFRTEYEEVKMEFPGWEQDETGWRYWQKDGIFPQESWLFIDDNWYFFDSCGYMVTERIILRNGREYYLGEDGTAQEQEEEKKARKGE